MRLFLAIAVLMLALVAFTEAQDDSIEGKLTRFGDQVAEVGKNLAEKAKTTFQNIHNSEAAVNTRDWFQRKMDELKNRFQ